MYPRKGVTRARPIQDTPGRTTAHLGVRGDAPHVRRQKRGMPPGLNRACYPENMVRRGLQTEIDDAVRSATEDVPVQRVLNWCRHIRARQVSVSLAGQMMGLPIGPKAVECSQVPSQWEAQTYLQAASGFIAANCVDCPFWETLSDDNIGQAIVNRVQAERETVKKRRVEEQATEDAIKRLVVPGIDAQAVLASDVRSDAHVRELVGLLADPIHRGEAAAKLREVARHYPHLFSPTLAELLTRLFSDGAVGADMIRIVSRLLDQYPDSLWPPVLAEAVQALRRYAYVDLAAEIVRRGLAEGRLPPTTELASLLMHHLDAPVEVLRHIVPGQRRIPRRQVAAAYRQAARLDYEACARTAARAAIDDDPHTRRQAAAAIIELVREFGASAAREFVGPILLGLSKLDDDDSGADAGLTRALAVCVHAAPEEAADAIFREMARYPEDVRELALRAFTLDDAVTEEAGWAPRVLALLADRSVGGELRRHVADRVSSFAQSHPSPLWSHFALMVGSLSLVCAEVDEIRQSRPGDDQPISPTEFFEYQGQLLWADGVARRLADAIAHVALTHPNESLRDLDAFLRNADTRIAPLFNAQVLRVLGMMGRASTRLAPRVVPLVSAHLIDPHSPHVRAAAADACEDLIHWNRDLLPEDTLVLLASLLGDQYLRPVVESAVRVFERARVASVDLGNYVLRALAVLYRAYRNQPEHSSLVRDIASAVTAVAEQHEVLMPAAVRMLELMSRDRHYYNAHDVIRDFRWFVRRHPEYGARWVRAMLDYYRRFGVKIRLQMAQYADPPDDDAFEELYRIDRELVVRHAPEIADFGRASGSDRNLRHIAALFITVGLHAEAAEMLDALVETLPAEPRFERRRYRYRALVEALRAEVALEAGDHEAAVELYTAAAEVLEEEGQVRQATTSPWDHDDPSRRFFAEWFAIRQRWLTLPHSADALATTAAQLTERVGGLGDWELAEREEVIRVLAEDLARAISFLARWRMQVLEGDPGSAASREAAIARLARAAEAAEELEHRTLRDTLVALAGHAAGLGPASNIRPLIDSVRSLALPLPRYDLPFPPGRRTRPAEPQPDATVTPRRVAPVVAVARMLVNEEEPPPVLAATAGQLYDLRVELDIPGLPANAERLALRWVSTLPRDAYDGPEDAIPLQQGHRQYQLAGHLRFVSPQADGSAPVSLKLLAEFETAEGDATVVELFGRHELLVRVYADAHPFRLSSALASVAVSKVMEGLRSIVPDRPEHERRDEEVVAQLLAGFAEYQLIEAPFSSTDKEAELERQLRQFVRWRAGPDCSYTQVQSGTGRIDVLIRGVPVELKVFKKGSLGSFVEQTLPQATQYVITQRRRVGFLVVLDLHASDQPSPPLPDCFAVRPGVTEPGFDPHRSGTVAMGVVVLRAQLTRPNQLRPPHIAAAGDAGSSGGVED